MDKHIVRKSLISGADSRIRTADLLITKKRVRELEEIIRKQNARWSSEWPGGVEIAAFTDTGELVSAEIRTARALGHAAVCTVNAQNVVRIYGIKLRD